MEEKGKNFSICSEAYYQFFHTINGYYKTPEQLSKAISKEIVPLADEMHLGYFGAYLDAPPNSLAPQGKHVKGDIYRGDYNAEEIWHIEFLTPEEGLCILSVAPTR